MWILGFQYSEEDLSCRAIRCFFATEQFVEPAPVHFSPFFFRFGYEILLYIKFFCWIGLDLILVLIPSCFGFSMKMFVFSIFRYFLLFFVFSPYFGLQKSVKKLILILYFRF